VLKHEIFSPHFWTNSSQLSLSGSKISIFVPRLHRHFTINSAINTTELKTVPTINIANAGIKWDIVNAKCSSPGDGTYLHLPLKDVRCFSSLQILSGKAASKYRLIRMLNLSRSGFPFLKRTVTPAETTVSSKEQTTLPTPSAPIP